MFDAPSEIVQLLPADLLRAALNKQPTNIATLFQLCVTRLADLIHSPTFPTQNALSNGPAGWFSSVAGTSTSIQSTREFLNAARVLSRLLPVMFEKLQTAPTQVNFAEDQASRNSAADWMLGIIWNPRQETVSAEEEANADQASQFVIDDEDEENQGEQQPQPTTREVPALGDTL